jgi:hypothetical protein
MAAARSVFKLTHDRSLERLTQVADRVTVRVDEAQMKTLSLIVRD